MYSRIKPTKQCLVNGIFNLHCQFVSQLTCAFDKCIHINDHLTSIYCKCDTFFNIMLHISAIIQPHLPKLMPILCACMYMGHNAVFDYNTTLLKHTHYYETEHHNIQSPSSVTLIYLYITKLNFGVLRATNSYPKLKVSHDVEWTSLN